MKLVSHIQKKDILIFLQQFSTLIIANVPLLQAIEVLEKSQLKPKLRLMLFSVKRDLASGKLLSQAFDNISPHFDLMTIQLIEVAEQTGKLDAILTMITNHYEKKLSFHAKIKQALMYPTFILISSILLFITLLIFIIPKFAELYASSNIKLPLYTQAIFKLSSLFTHIYWLLILLPALLWTLHRYQRIKLPRFFIYENYKRKCQITSFIRNLAITLAAGLPIVSAIKISSAKLFPDKDQTRISNLIANLQAGMNLHFAMRLTTLFPPYIIQMVKIGEESGKLDFMLHKSADSMEADIDRSLALIHQLLEPLIMLILGVLIGGLVIAMYLPIFRLGTSL